jgi:hypothetical protein
MRSGRAELLGDPVLLGDLALERHHDRHVEQPAVGILAGGDDDRVLDGPELHVVQGSPMLRILAGNPIGRLRHDARVRVGVGHELGLHRFRGEPDRARLTTTDDGHRVTRDDRQAREDENGVRHGSKCQRRGPWSLARRAA